MKVQCGHCPAKYAVADERLRDKKVRIRCRRCNAAIVVDGKVSPPLVTSTPARPSAGPGFHAPESLPPSNPPPDHPRPVAHTIMGGLEAPVTHQLMHAHFGRAAAEAAEAVEAAEAGGAAELRTGKPDSSRGFTDPPVRGEADRWRVALTQQDLRWMTTEEITQAFKDGAVKSETFVFRAGMATWVTLLEVTEIAQALADAHLVSPPLRTFSLGEPEVLATRSSSPPPRKASRPREASPLAELLAAAGEGAEPEESMPFALVAERAGSKRPEPGVAAPVAAAEPSGPALAAAFTEQPAGTGAEPPAGADAEPPAGTDAEPPAGTDAEPPAVGEQPAVAPPPAAGPPPTFAAGTPPLAPAAREGSKAWIWISLAVVLALAAGAVLLGPRFGLRLR